MSRYVNVFRVSVSPEQAQGVASAYLQQEGFKYLNHRGEMLWRKGFGAFANPQFVKVEPGADGTIQLTAWTAGFTILPGWYVGEMDPTRGFWGFAPKRLLRNRVTELERRLGATPALQMPMTAQQPTLAQPAPAAEASASAQPSAPAPAVAQQPAAGWFPDPRGRHQHRFWDGAQWTDRVADGGQTTTDAFGMS